MEVSSSRDDGEQRHGRPHKLTIPGAQFLVTTRELSHNGVTPAFQAGPDGFDPRSSL